MIRKCLFPVLLTLLVFSPAITKNHCFCQSQTIAKEEIMRKQRAEMVKELMVYGIQDQKVLEAMGKVARHRFIPTAFQTDLAYGDHPLPIGHGQSISQPYIVAYMTEKIAPPPGEKVLEIGTGSGYQAAVLAELGAKVFSIEIIEELASHASEVLSSEGYAVTVKHGDGYLGWQEHSPFSTIIVTCAPEKLPAKLVEQLAEGGRMILPLGDSSSQRLVIIRKKGGKTSIEEDLPVRFVPMITK